MKKYLYKFLWIYNHLYKKYTALCFLFFEVSFMFLFLRFLSFILSQNNLPTWPVFTVWSAERTQARPTNKPKRPKRTKVIKVCTLSPFKGPTNVEWFLGGPSPIPWSTRKIARHYLYSVSKWYFVTKIVLTYWEKIVLVIKKNFWIFEFLRSLEQFIQTVKCQNNF